MTPKKFSAPPWRVGVAVLHAGLRQLRDELIEDCRDIAVRSDLEVLNIIEEIGG